MPKSDGVPSAEGDQVPGGDASQPESAPLNEPCPESAPAIAPHTDRLQPGLAAAPGLSLHAASSAASAGADLSGYEVLVGVTGGIAAYKTCAVVSRLAQRGVGVTVAMTQAATQFVAPLTFRTLSGRAVLTSLWGEDTPYEAQHIGATDAADLLIIAPATANIIAKIAHGLADDLLSTLVLSADSPVLIVPGMNARMWANPITQQNVARLSQLGYRFLGPGEGWLACRATGAGRMVEPEDILDSAATMLKAASPKRLRAGGT
jgi:phosphopantothenoylcysteine decarboxylase/phosphopantothenate--cysteine ligase